MVGKHAPKNIVWTPLMGYEQNQDLACGLHQLPYQRSAHLVKITGMRLYKIYDVIEMLHALVKVQVSSGIVKSLVMLPMHICSTPYKKEVYLYYLCQEVTMSRYVLINTLADRCVI